MKYIPLTQDKVTIIDDADECYLANWKWFAKKSRNVFYAETKHNNKGLKMHRLLTGAKPGQIVDHINRNPLDNRRENLRICSFTENAQNTSKRKNGKSRYLGVCFHKQHRKWYAQIQVKGKKIFLGLFLDDNLAALAYNNAAMKHFGQFANLNTIRYEQ